MSENLKPLLEVNHLSKFYSAKTGVFSKDNRMVKAVNDVSFCVYPGETIGIVGESGCGKTTLGKAVLHLIDDVSGEVSYQGQDILSLKGKKLRQMRREFQIVYQDPYTSLNPRKKIGFIIAEPLLVQKMADRKHAMKRAEELLEIVGLSRSFAGKYPYECSGGQRQRVGIARALACEAKMIVCDEAVSALDVSTQSQIINLLEEVQEKFHLTYLFISHGLSVVRHISDRVMVMYLGQIVEMAEAAELYDNPLHPYTEALFSANPIPDPEVHKKRIILEGDVPNPLDIPSGCPFRTRCRYAEEKCVKERPLLKNISGGHLTACHLVKEKSAVIQKE